jgi:hypothetical protein
MYSTLEVNKIDLTLAMEAFRTSNSKLEFYLHWLRDFSHYKIPSKLLVKPPTMTPTLSALPATVPSGKPPTVPLMLLTSSPRFYSNDPVS